MSAQEVHERASAISSGETIPRAYKSSMKRLLLLLIVAFLVVPLFDQTEQQYNQMWEAARQKQRAQERERREREKANTRSSKGLKAELESILLGKSVISSVPLGRTATLESGTGIEHPVSTLVYPGSGAARYRAEGIFGGVYVDKGGYRLIYFDVSAFRVAKLDLKGDRFELLLNSGIGDPVKLEFLFGKDWQKSLDAAAVLVQVRGILSFDAASEQPQTVAMSAQTPASLPVESELSRTSLSSTDISNTTTNAPTSSDKSEAIPVGQKPEIPIVVRSEDKGRRSSDSGCPVGYHRVVAAFGSYCEEHPSPPGSLSKRNISVTTTKADSKEVQDKSLEEPSESESNLPEVQTQEEGREATDVRTSTPRPSTESALASNFTLIRSSYKSESSDSSGVVFLAIFIVLSSVIIFVVIKKMSVIRKKSAMRKIEERKIEERKIEAKRRLEEWHREEEEQFKHAEDQFRQAVSTDGFLCEEVLSFLTSNYPKRQTPESLWDRLGYRATYGDVRERWSSVAEYKEVTTKFAALVASCAEPWSELMRITRAYQGNEFSAREFIVTAKYDVLQILHAFWAANGGAIPDAIGRLCQAVLSELEPKVRATVADCIKEIRGTEKLPGSLPATVKVLSEYKKLMPQKAFVEVTAASAYNSLVFAASGCCSNSDPVNIIRNSYLQELRPYIQAESSQSERDTSSSNSRKSGESTTQFNGNCPKCAKYYSVLRIKPSASVEDIEAAHRDLAQIYHTDRFQGKGERLRRTAEEEMTKVNEAYSHIMEHFEPQHS
jgi:hypothetical protein